MLNGVRETVSAWIWGTQNEAPVAQQRETQPWLITKAVMGAWNRVCNAVSYLRGTTLSQRARKLEKSGLGKILTRQRVDYLRKSARATFSQRSGKPAFLSALGRKTVATPTEGSGQPGE